MDTSRDISRASSRSRDIGRSRDSSRDSLVSGESGVSRESCRSRDCKSGAGLRSRNLSKETVISKDSCVDRLSSRSQTLDRSRNGARRREGLAGASSGSICSNYQDTSRNNHSLQANPTSSVSRRHSERCGEKSKSKETRRSAGSLLDEGTRREPRGGELKPLPGDISSSTRNSIYLSILQRVS